jgi:tetratricopeptide (TPR) repeat protein
VKAELRSLPRSLADLVAQHLVASGRFLDDDPERAYLHALTARRLAARLGSVREAVAITAYLAEHYDEALTEFRAVRRMTGNHEVLAMMADCERALGRPDKALALLKDKHVNDLSEATQMELLIVGAGARRDLGQKAAAVQMLDVPELTKRTRAEWLPRLRFAYADALEDVGRTDDALVWFHRAAGVDQDGETGAAERAARLEGLEFTDLDEDTVVPDEYFEEEDSYIEDPSGRTEDATDDVDDRTDEGDDLDDGEDLADDGDDLDDVAGDAVEGPAVEDDSDDARAEELDSDGVEDLGGKPGDVEAGAPVESGDEVVEKGEVKPEE